MLYFPCSTWIKKDINGADQLWGIRDLTDFHRQAQCCLSSQRLFLQQSAIRPGRLPITSSAN